MTDFSLNSAMGDPTPVQPASRPNLDKGFNPLTMILFFGTLVAGLLFVAWSIYVDVDATGAKVTTYLPYILLLIALVIALGFEFVNGFHDTANAVAGCAAPRPPKAKEGRSSAPAFCFRQNRCARPSCRSFRTATHGT